HLPHGKVDHVHAPARQHAQQAVVVSPRVALDAGDLEYILLGGHRYSRQHADEKNPAHCCFHDNKLMPTSFITKARRARFSFVQECSCPSFFPSCLRDEASSNQSSVGCSTESITVTSTAALVDSSFRPSCSCTAV